MEKAIHVATGKVIFADKAYYEQYYGIFQCPSCHESLTLRKGYIRGDGVEISAAFVHPDGNFEDCKNRVSGSGNNKQSFVDAICRCRGQNFRKLESLFWKGFKSFVERKWYDIFHTDYSYIASQLEGRELARIIEYNIKPGNAHENPELFLFLANVVLKCPQNHRFFVDKKNDLKKFFLENEEKLSYFELVREEKKISVNEQIKRHCYQVETIAIFLSKSASDNLRRKILEVAIFGQSNLPVPDRNYWSPTHIKQYRCFQKEETLRQINEKREVYIKQLCIFPLDRLNTTMTDQNLRRVAFTSLYKNQDEQDEIDRDLRDARNFIGFVLERVFDAIAYYDWSMLDDE